MKKTIFGIIVVLIAVLAIVYSFALRNTTKDDKGENGGVVVTTTITTTTDAAVKETMNLLVYFINTKKDPAMLDCSKVYPVVRTFPKAITPGQIAVEALLQGPTEQEKNDGFVSTIPANAKLIKLTIVNGVATANFDRTFNQGVGGSCRVIAMRSQVAETLKQFSTVKEVVLAVEGKTEDILEP